MSRGLLTVAAVRKRQSRQCWWPVGYLVLLHHRYCFPSRRRGPGHCKYSCPDVARCTRLLAPVLVVLPRVGTTNQASKPTCRICGRHGPTTARLHRQFQATAWRQCSTSYAQTPMWPSLPLVLLNRLAKTTDAGSNPCFAIWHWELTKLLVHFVTTPMIMRTGAGTLVASTRKLCWRRTSLQIVTIIRTSLANVKGGHAGPVKWWQSWRTQHWSPPSFVVDSGASAWWRSRCCRQPHLWTLAFHLFFVCRYQFFPKVRPSITGSTWSTFCIAQSCSTRTMLLSKNYAEWALEGMVLKGRFRRTAVGGWHYFSILNDHVTQKCAARRSICINLLLLMRSRCVQEGVTLLTGYFNKGVQRGRLGEPSPLEAAFSRAPVPWPSLGKSAHWRSGEHELARFLWHFKLPHANRGWLIKKHGRFDMGSTAVGLEKTEQSFYSEQGMQSALWPWGIKCDGRRQRSDQMVYSRTLRRRESWWVWPTRILTCWRSWGLFFFLLTDVRRLLLPVLSNHLFSWVTWSLHVPLVFWCFNSLMRLDVLTVLIVRMETLSTDSVKNVNWLMTRITSSWLLRLVWDGKKIMLLWRHAFSGKTAVGTSGRVLLLWKRAPLHQIQTVKSAVNQKNMDHISEKKKICRKFPLRPGTQVHRNLRGYENTRSQSHSKQNMGKVERIAGDKEKVRPKTEVFNVRRRIAKHSTSRTSWIQIYTWRVVLRLGNVRDELGYRAVFT